MDLGSSRVMDFWRGSREAGDVLLPAPLPVLGERTLWALAGARVGMWQFDWPLGAFNCDEVTRDLLGLDAPADSDARLTVHEEDRQPVFAALEACFRDGAPRDMEFRAVSPGGHIRWFHVRAWADEHRSLFGFTTDITDRKTAEAALQESERQLRALVDNLPGVAYRCALEPPWPVSFISDATERLTGYPAESFRTGEIDWQSIVFPEDAAGVAAAVEQAIADRVRFRLEYRIVCRSGEVRWVQERGGAAYGSSGEPLFLEGFIGDIHDHVLARERLREAEERYRLISEAAMDVTWDLDLLTDEFVTNDAKGTFFGYERGSLKPDGQWWLQRVHPDDQARLQAEVERTVASGGSQYTSEHRFRRADGSYADVFACGYVVRDESLRPVRMVGAMQDLSARKLADAALRESEAINRSIVESTADCVVLLDLDGRVIFANGGALRAMRMDESSNVEGRSWVALWPAEVQPHVLAAIEAAAAGGPGRFSADASEKDGRTTSWDVVITPVLAESGAVTKFAAISRDVTERKEAEARLLWAATRDSLTNLANRDFFQRKLGEAVARARRERRRMGLLLLDLDDFKQVNDTLGHDAGDALLKALALRLTGVCDDSAVIARLGGDEFAIIIEDIEGEADLRGRVAPILRRMREPILHAGRILDCQVTIGAAICPDHAVTPEELLKNADIALYSAKASRRGNLAVFEPGLRSNLLERMSMIRCARDAVREDRIVPFYQPKVVIGEQAVHGFEALLRWHDGAGTMHLPQTIMAAFDDLDVATAISDRMIDRVILDMRDWLDGGLDFGHVAVNAAAAEFRRDDFAEGLLERLARAGVPATCLQLEVTETVFLGRGAEYVERALKLLSSHGISIALDDFGTGYASLRHLKQFPVHAIKIDQSFVRDMGTDPDDAAIIAAVLNLGRSLGLTVVAEGIETESQENHLRSLGCRYAQGFLYSQAVPAAKVPALLASWGRSEATKGAAPSQTGLTIVQRQLLTARKSATPKLHRVG